MKSSALVLALALAGLVTACAASSSRSGFDATDPAPAGSGDGASSSGDPGGLGGGSSSGSTSPPGPTGTTVLYAHTDTTLYQADPDDLTKPLVKVGDFDCVGKSGAMTDIAVTKDGSLFGVSEGAAYPLTITGSTVHCASTWSLPQTKFYGLTVAPENTVAAAEVLIGADGQGGLYQIDQSSGTPTQVGTLGTDPKTNQPWALSGDIVFMANGGSPIGFATVRTCTGGSGSCASTDTLIEVDVGAIKPGAQSVMKAVRGAVVKGSWCTDATHSSYGSMFGIVAYKDKVYGFARTGDIVEIHNGDGTGCLVSSNASQKFAGAGITTVAPVVAPPAVN